MQAPNRHLTCCAKCLPSNENLKPACRSKKLRKLPRYTLLKTPHSNLRTALAYLEECPSKWGTHPRHPNREGQPVYGLTPPESCTPRSRQSRCCSLHLRKPGWIKGGTVQLSLINTMCPHVHVCPGSSSFKDTIIEKLYVCFHFM